MIKQINILISCVAFISISSNCIEAQTPKPTASATATPEKAAKVSSSESSSAFKDIPTPSLQRQADKLTDKIETLQNSITDFTDYANRVTAIQKSLPLTPPPEVTVRASSVAETFNTLKAAKADDNVVSSIAGTPGARSSDALQELQAAIGSSFTEAISKVVPSFNLRFSLGVQAHVPTPSEQLAEDAASGLPDPRRARSLDKVMPHLTALANALYRLQTPGQNRVDLKRSAIDAEINAAQAEAANVQSLASQAFNDCADNYKKVFDAVVKRLQDEVKKLNDTIDADNKQLTEINKIIASRSQDVGTRQNRLTDVLFYTELLMIGAIAIAITFLRIYPSHLAVTIVQERTFGDMLGMGLLLITVIFLSTGDFIDKSAVVTLLGTIAGYIFARPARAAQPSSPGTSTPSPLPAPTNLQATLPAVPGQASVSCDPVPGAIAYRWYAKLEGAAGDPTFRIQSTPPHTVLSGFKAGDKVIITVTATNGQESPPSAPLTVTIS